MEKSLHKDSYNSIPSDLLDIIYKYKHQLEFADCLGDIKGYNYDIKEYNKFGKIFYETSLLDMSTSHLNWVLCKSKQYIHKYCMKPYGYLYTTSFCWKGKKFDYKEKNNFYCQCI